MTVARYVSLRGDVRGRIEDALANAEGLRALRRRTVSRLPFPALISDVREVLYANWVVDTRALADRIPPGVRVREVGGRTILTLLAYRHGHFGPARLGRARHLFASPLQANWRLYVEAIEGAAPGANTVLFLANIFASLPHALGTRVMSDVMLSQRARAFEHRVDVTGWATGADGAADAPWWHLSGTMADGGSLPPAFEPFFSSHGHAVQVLCLQDAAIAPVAGATGALAVSRIDLPIAVDTVRPLAVERYVPGALLRDWGATGEPLCFRVPSVRFRVLSEGLLAR